MRTWAQPDIKVHEGNVPTDVALAFEGYYLMHESQSFGEFKRRWEDEKEREILWKEIVEYWGVEEAFPKPPLKTHAFPRDRGWISWH